MPAKSPPPARARRARNAPETAYERAWNVSQLSRLARELAALAVAELTRASGPVRDPRFQARIERLLRRSFGPGEIAAVVKELSAASLHLCHPRYMAQQVAAPLPAAALVESAVASLNQSLAVWRMSPAGTPLDRALTRRFQRLFGYPAGAEGSFVPGGSFANLTALLAARGALDPRAWREGGARVALLCGEQAHYSLRRAAGILGLGTDAVFPIPLDRERRTDPAAVPAAVRDARRAGYRKFVLVATSGSTPTASFDRLRALAAQARAAGAWFHVDAAHGGGMMYSRRYRRLMAGIAQADSIAFDPHKMMFMPLAAGYVLVRRGDHLRRAFEQDAPYLFSAVERDYPDLARFTLACSQRFEALKVWLALEAYGERFFGVLAERACAAAAAAYAYCRSSALLEPVHRPAANIFCFRLRRRLSPASASSRLHFALEEAVNASGKGYLSSTELDGERVLRMVVMNPRSRPADAIANLRLVERLSRTLA